jgi:hypothetical protein
LETARGHDWSLDGISIAEFVAAEASLTDEERYTVFHPDEVELATTIKRLLKEIERVGAQRVVVGSNKFLDRRTVIGFTQDWGSYGEQTVYKAGWKFHCQG